MKGVGAIPAWRGRGEYVDARSGSEGLLSYPPASKNATDMRADDAGLIEVNGITLLVGLILILVVVMGGYTFATPQESLAEPEAPQQAGDYGVVVTESTVGVEKHGGDPVVYDQLVLYVGTEETTQRLPISESVAEGDDGDALYEPQESIRRPLNTSIPAGSSVSVKLVDTGGSAILFETTVNATESAST